MFGLFGGSKRPNTQITFTLFKPHSQPMPPCPLKPDAWEKALEKYSDKNYTKSLVGMLRYGALIGYTGERLGKRIYPNHGSARKQPELLEDDLREQLGNKRLAVYTAQQLPDFFVSSPIGLVDKNDGSKRRVHDLSYPEGSSVNDGIHGERTKVVYSTLQDIMNIMKEVGSGCIFIKRDFKDAYRHIPISPTDSKMLGFAWESEFFEERFLPFGLSSAPFLFNFVAEGFHWIMEQRLKPLKGKVVHYLDDFLIVLPKRTNWRNAVRIFDETAAELGLIIKTSKNREGEVTDFVGFELDSKRMVARLSHENLEKTRMLVTKWIDKETISTKELEHLLGKLDRASKVVPVGRTHCRRLIAIQDKCQSDTRYRENRTIKITDEARKELDWWKNILPTNPCIAVSPSNRKTIEVFTSGSGFKGMGGYYLKDKQELASLSADQFFMMPHPERNVQEKDPLPREMMAVERAIQKWTSVFKGFRVVFNTSCQGVAYGLLNHSIHSNGPPLDTLKRILTLGGKHDIDIWSHWIPNDDNELAIVLSRYERDKINALAPKLGVLGASRSKGRFSISQSRFSPSESQFAPSENQPPASQSQFSPSQSRFAPSENRSSTSGNQSTSENQPPTSQSRFSPSQSRFAPSENRPATSENQSPTSQSRFSPPESQSPTSGSRFRPSESQLTPPEGTEQMNNKGLGHWRRQAQPSRNFSPAPVKISPPPRSRSPPSSPPPPYKRTPSPPPKECQPLTTTKPKYSRKKPRKAVLNSEPEVVAGVEKSSGALDLKENEHGRFWSHISLSAFFLFLFHLICMLGCLFWKLIRFVTGL